MTLVQNNRVVEVDKRFDADVTSADYKNRLFTRLSAKGRRFSRVSFEFCIFDYCYLRNCTFDSCNFTGCRFQNSNLHGSSFTGCKFDYATFERTQIDSDILDSSCPSHENLKMRFARSLRVNYQQIGDAASANNAIMVELAATEVFLHKSWHSNDSYHRYKYKGWDRFKMFLKWTNFKILDFVWGNGESSLKLLRTVVLIFFGIYLTDIIFFEYKSDSILADILSTPKLFFLSTAAERHYPEGYLAFITFLRLLMFGLFMSIIIKRFNRR